MLHHDEARCHPLQERCPDVKPSRRDSLTPPGMCSTGNVLHQEVTYRAGRDRKEREGHVMPKQIAVLGKCQLKEIWYL